MFGVGDIELVVLLVVVHVADLLPVGKLEGVERRWVEVDLVKLQNRENESNSFKNHVLLNIKLGTTKIEQKTSTKNFIKIKENKKVWNAVGK